MIRYELKDKERQAALEKALPGFAEALQRDCYHQRADEEGGITYVAVSTYDWIVRILKTDIVCAEAYDPHAWNEYPKVIPPEGALMRVEGHYRLHCQARYIGAARWCNGKWYPAEPTTPSKDAVVERFRPWDEEEDK